MARNRTVGAVTCSLALIFTAACAAEAPARASLSTTSDSAGVKIVRGPATDTALPWRLVELRRFGGADSGALTFTRVSRSSVATDGHAAIAVLDHDNDNRIHVFDTTGAVLRSMGHTGGGPGETQYPHGLRMDATGAVSVFDGSKSALVRWGPDGSPLPELRLTSARGSSWGSPRVQGDTMWVLLSFTDSLNAVRRLERWTPTDTLFIDSTFSPKPRMVMFKCVGLALPPLFSPELEWTVEAGQLAITAQSRYVVDLREGGRLTRSIRRDIAPVAAQTTDANRLFPDGLKVRFGSSGECVTPSAEVGEKVGVAATIPVVRSAVMSPDGSLWVERYTFQGETPAVDVFDREGQYLGTLTGRSLPLGFLDNNRVLFAIVNPEDDTTVIGLFRIER
jgi:hypothetical protein